jgi:hypothetical protein
MLPDIHSNIMFAWGDEIVVARVIHLETPSCVQVIETTDPKVFGGQRMAFNINFHHQDWVYDDLRIP